MSTIPLRLLVPGRVYRYSWRGINLDEEQRKKLVRAEILPLEELQIGHIFQNEGLFMYLYKDTQTYGFPVPVGYVRPIPQRGFKGETPEEYVYEPVPYENLKVMLPPSSFKFSELERPAPAAGPVGAGAGPAVPAPPSKKEQEDAARYKQDEDMAGGRKNRRHSRTKRNRRRRWITRKRV